MEVRSVWSTRDRVEAEAACEELRAHGIKCDIVEATLPYVGSASMWDPGMNVVVAGEEEQRAGDVLDAWADALPEPEAT